MWYQHSDVMDKCRPLMTIPEQQYQQQPPLQSLLFLETVERSSFQQIGNPSSIQKLLCIPATLISAERQVITEYTHTWHKIAFESGRARAIVDQACVTARGPLVLT